MGSCLGFGKFILFSGVFFAAIGPAVPQERAGGQGSPRIEVAEPSIDLGRVSKGQSVEARFALRNTGTGLLKIHQVKPG